MQTVNRNFVKTKVFQIIIGLLIFFGTATVMVSCFDPCKDIPCINGTCKEGVCICNAGFSGIKCEKDLLQFLIGSYISNTSCSSNSGAGNVSIKFDPNNASNLIMQNVFPFYKNLDGTNCEIRARVINQNNIIIDKQLITNSIMETVSGTFFVQTSAFDNTVFISGNLNIFNGNSFKESCSISMQK